MKPKKDRRGEGRVTNLNHFPFPVHSWACSCAFEEGAKGMKFKFKTKLKGALILVVLHKNLSMRTERVSVYCHLLLQCVCLFSAPPSFDPRILDPYC